MHLVRKWDCEVGPSQVVVNPEVRSEECRATVFISRIRLIVCASEGNKGSEWVQNVEQ
jgi:hypothetical protein